MKDERILFDLNKELAILMGWQVTYENVVVFAGDIVKYIHTHIKGVSPACPNGPVFDFPDFINNRKEFFYLLMQFKPDISFGEGFVTSYIDGNSEGILCEFDDWDSKELATVVSVMKSAIKHLKG